MIFNTLNGVTYGADVHYLVAKWENLINGYKVLQRKCVFGLQAICFLF
jgi:hypothetical protein